MKNHGPLGSYTGIIRNTTRKHSGKTTYLTLVIPLTALLFAGSAPRAQATGKLTVNPGSLAFGNITVGTTETKTISLKNSGTTAVRVSGDSLIGVGYRISGISFPKTLSWKASTSSGVVGYNVYRGTTSGGPYTKLDSSPIAGTSYSDSSVSSGEYYYVVAAINLDGTESGYSNQAAVSVL